jgi:hypothetical protein
MKEEDAMRWKTVRVINYSRNVLSGAGQFADFEPNEEIVFDTDLIGTGKAFKIKIGINCLLAMRNSTSLLVALDRR